MSKRTIKVGHLYECYPLYQMLYGGTSVSKHVESLANTQIIAHYLGNIRTKKATRLNAIELGSGQSEHKDYYLKHAKAIGLPIGKYVENDLFRDDLVDATSFEDVIYGPADTADFVTSSMYGAYDLVFGNYHQVSSLMDQSTAAFHQMLANATEICAPYGAILFDTHADSQAFTYASLTRGDSESWVHDIPYGHGLRATCDIPPFADATLEVQIVGTYNRLTNTTTDTLHDVIIRCGKSVVEIKVANVFQQRIRTVTDIMDYVMSQPQPLRAYFYRYAYESARDNMVVTPLDPFQESNVSETLEGDAAIAHIKSLTPNKILLVKQ